MKKACVSRGTGLFSLPQLFFLGWRKKKQRIRISLERQDDVEEKKKGRRREEAPLKERASSCLVSLRVIFSLSFTRVFTQYMTQWDSEEKRGILCFKDWEKNILLALVTKRCTLGSKRHIQSVANNDSLSFLSVSSLFHPCLLRVKENSKDCPLNHVMLLLHRWEEKSSVSFSRFPNRSLSFFQCPSLS